MNVPRHKLACTILTVNIRSFSQNIRSLIFNYGILKFQFFKLIVYFQWKIRKLGWFLNDYVWSYTFNLMIVYFHRYDRIASKPKDHIHWEIVYFQIMIVSLNYPRLKIYGHSFPNVFFLFFGYPIFVTTFLFIFSIHLSNIKWCFQTTMFSMYFSSKPLSAISIPKSTIICWKWTILYL